MTVPVICGDVRNPFNNKKSRSYKKTELIITAVLTNSNSSAVSSDQDFSVSDSEITDVHMLKPPGHEQSLVPLPEEPDVDVDACFQAMNNFLGKSSLKMLDGKPDLNEKSLCQLWSIFQIGWDTGKRWWLSKEAQAEAEARAQVRWKASLNVAHCQPGDFALAFSELLKSNTFCNWFRLMAESIDREPDRRHVIPMELQNLIAEYVNIELSSSLKEWESLLEQYRQNNNPTSQVMNQICQHVENIDDVNDKLMSKIVRRNWIRMGKLRIEFENWLKTNESLVRGQKDLTEEKQRIDSMFELVIQRQEHDRINDIREALVKLMKQTNAYKERTSPNYPELWKITNSYVGASELEKLSALNYSDDSMMELLNYFKKLSKKNQKMFFILLSRRVEGRWNKFVQLHKCQFHYLLPEFKKWLESDAVDENSTVLKFYRLVAELINRKSESCKYIPIQLQTAAEMCVVKELNDYARLWDLIYYKYLACLSSIAPHVDNKKLSKTTRLNWLRIALLRVRLEDVRGIAESLEQYSDLVKKFDEVIKSDKPHEADELEKSVKDLEIIAHSTPQVRDHCSFHSPSARSLLNPVHSPSARKAHIKPSKN